MDNSPPPLLVMTTATVPAWPLFPLAEWQATHHTLHMWSQVVGKTRLALAPMENHWWQVPLYVTPRGLTTSAMPAGHRSAEAEFDFIDHQLRLRVSDGAERSIRLDSQSVADFYAEYLEALRSLGLELRIRPVPVEVETAIPFVEDTAPGGYHPNAANCWWRILAQTDRVLKRFCGSFLGKQSPVHFFWGSFDLAATRFSGRRAPLHPGGAPNCPNYVMTEAYSHECCSCGIWPGAGPVTGPTYYAYAYPAPPGYADFPIRPAGARYHPDLGEFILPYEAVRSSPIPDDSLLEFVRSAYQAAATLGQWNRAELERAEP